MRIGEKMKIILQEEIYEFLNQVNEIEKLFDLINKKLDESHLQLSHLIIDEIPIYQDYYDYFINHIEKIMTVEVICNHLEGLVNDALISAHNYLTNAIPVIQELSESFYHNPKDETWSKLVDLFDGIQWIIETEQRIDSITDLEKIIKNYLIWNEYVQCVKKIISILPELEEAMQNRDHVLIGDLLLYEILPSFEVCEEKMRFLIPNQGADYVS